MYEDWLSFKPHGAIVVVVRGNNQQCPPSLNLSCFFKTKLGELDMTRFVRLQLSSGSYCSTTKEDFRFEQI